MRIKSQNGMVDLPYEQIVIAHDNLCPNTLIAFGINGDPARYWTVAEYKTESQAKKAMTRLHTAYMKVTAQREKTGLIHYANVPKVWQFPSEEEIEGR